MIHLRVRHLVFAHLSVAAALLVAASAPAQTPTGRITGTVRDANRQGREGARVAAINSATGISKSTTTGANGSYSVTGLPAGEYTVTASLIGFQRVTSTAVQVADGAEVTVDLVLQALQLQTVVVTATLREQQLQDVPFSVASPTAAVLRERGADNIEMVAANVAGFAVQNLGPGQSVVAIRGTSSGQIARDQPGVKGEAGVYLDDSPISLSLFSPDMDLFDMSRVEVLRGPQGTLFGSGSLSGTVRYISNQPRLGEHSTFGEVGGNVVDGGSAGGDLKIGTNVPIGDKAAARLSAYYTHLPGYMDAVQPDLSVHNNVNSGARTGVRAAVLIQPNSKLSITPRFLYQNVNMDGWNRNDAYNILGNPFTTTRPAVDLGPRQLFTQIPEPYTDNFVLSDLKATYDWGKVNLTSITAFNYRDILVVRDAGALTSSITGGSIGLSDSVYTLNAPLDDKTNSHVWTEELRLAGGQDRLHWLVGGFFGSSKRKYGQNLLVSGFEAATGIPTVGLRAPKDVLFFSDLSYRLKEAAAFGEATFSVTEKLDLTAGLRYYHFDEDRDQIFDGIFANDSTGTKVVSTPGSTSANGVAPRFIVSYKVNDAVRLNAQASRGFRLGGINDPLNVPLCTPQDLVTFSGRDSWKDETAWNYEVGVKSQWMRGKATFNASAFWMDVSDLQLTVTAGSCSSRLVFNVPKSWSRGLEFEFAMAPTSYFDFAITASFNDSQLRSTLTSTDTAGNVSVVSGIQEGNRLPSVPKYQGAAAVTFHKPLGSGLQGAVTGVYNHVGSRYTLIDDLASGFGTVNLNSFAPNNIGGPYTQNTFTFNPLLPAYDLFNLRFAVSRGLWEAALFINNLTDERALLALDRERGTRARVGYLVNPPRTFGLTLTFTLY